MKDEWWYASEGARKGPIRFEALREKLLNGSLSASDMVWTEGMSAWKPITDVPMLDQILRALPPELPSFTVTAPAPEPEPAPVPKPPALSAPTAPWRRFFARFIDLWVIGLPTVFLVVLFLAPVWPGFALWLQQPGADFALGFLVIPLVLVIEAVIFAAFFTTIGKWLLGIRVTTAASKIPTFFQYLYRQLGVYWAGLGTGFPLVSFFTYLRQYRRLKAGMAASYDEGLFKVTVQKIGIFRYLAAAAVVAVLVMANGILQMMTDAEQRRPAVGAVSSNGLGNENDVEVSQPSQPSEKINPKNPFDQFDDPKYSNDKPQLDLSEFQAKPAPQHINPLHPPRTLDAIQPESEDANQVRKHFNTIEAAHPDFEIIGNSDEFKQWASNSPVRRRIYETGTTDEVIRMLHEYKIYLRQIGSDAFEHRRQLTEAERARNEAAYEALVRRH